MYWDSIKTIILVYALIIASFSFSSAALDGDETDNEQNIKIIRIAQYPIQTPSSQLFEIIFNYTWESNNTLYKYDLSVLNLDEIKGRGNTPLNNDNFDLLAVGASFNSFTKDGLDPILRENIQKFLSNGGGYLSSCGGTIFSTQGYENPETWYEKRLNKCVLGITDTYINMDYFEENQYMYKLGLATRANQGLPPIEKRVLSNNTNPIFSKYPYDTINFTYGGGPGLYTAHADDSNLGEITPLLIINEELMETKPIHWWKKVLIGWKKGDRVKTDLKGYYGGIATTYGKGRVVVFTAHAEIQLLLNGAIDEFIGKPCGYPLNIPPIRIVYSWTGTPMNMSQNWWVHRRAAAWIAGVTDDDLPPCNHLMVFMDKPQFRLGYQLYINDELKNFRIGNRIFSRIMNSIGKTIIIGDITVEAYAENSDFVEFYLDGNLEYIDNEPPFKWKLSKKLDGIHNIELRAFDEFGNCVRDGSEFLFYNL